MPPIRSITDLDLTRRYTYADYLTWQLGEWVELIRGQIVRRMSPAPTDRHQVLVGELYFHIKAYLHRRPCQVRLAPYDVRLATQGPNAADEATETVVQPDLCVICDLTKIDQRGCKGAPDWIIEVLSPGTYTRDTRDKLALYEENGVGEYWIVAPGEQNVAVFVLDEAAHRYVLRGEYAGPGPIPCHTLPELVIDWAEVFESNTPTLPIR